MDHHNNANNANMNGKVRLSAGFYLFAFFFPRLGLLSQRARGRLYSFEMKLDRSYHRH